MIYLTWLVILLIPYWLGPIIVWLTQKAGARPVFEPFAPGRHVVPEDVAASFRQTCDALATEGFRVAADLFQTGQMRHVSTRVALLDHAETTELALAVATFTAARPARLVASYAELPTKFRDGRTVSVHNSPLLGSFTPPPSRVVVRLPIVRDPARLCRVKRAYLDRHYRGLERVPFEHQDDPARFLADAMVRELTEQVEAGRWRHAAATSFAPVRVGDLGGAAHGRPRPPLHRAAAHPGLARVGGRGRRHCLRRHAARLARTPRVVDASF